MTRSVFALILGSAVVKMLHRPCNRVPSRFDGTLASLTCSLTCSSHANHPTGHPSAVPAWIWILPQSTKAQAMAAAVQRHRPSVQWWCPQLPPSPAAVMRLLLNDLTDWPLAAKGSQRQPKAAKGHCGVVAGWVLRGGSGASFALPGGTCQSSGSSGAGPGPAPWHADQLARRSTNIFFTPRFIDELQAMGSGRITAPAHTLTLIAQGDEVLDGREMTALCTGAQVRLL